MTCEGASHSSFEARNERAPQDDASAWIDNALYAFSTPHHSAMNSAVALVD